ncbi:MAG: hypothetical protein J7L23_02710 [Candidatus Diapherotrites archaeon]|nr:hypothetical protein [Candidatus Diapherotrites archaeon]
MPELEYNKELVESHKLGLLRLAISRKFSIYRERGEMKKNWDEEENILRESYKNIYNSLKKKGIEVEKPQSLEKRIQMSVNHLEELKNTATRYANISKIDSVINLVKAIVDMDASRNLYDGLSKIANKSRLSNEELDYLDGLKKRGRLKNFSKDLGLEDNNVGKFIDTEKTRKFYKKLADRLMEEEINHQKAISAGVEKYGRERGYSDKEIRDMLERITNRKKAFKRLRDLANSMPEQRRFIEKFIKEARVKPEPVWHHKKQAKLEDF